MKKVGIITIYNSNYGNRLQNYDLQEILCNFGVEVVTIKNNALLNKKTNFINYFLRNIKALFVKSDFIDAKERENKFIEFNKNIKSTSKCFNWFRKKMINKFDYLIVGSDQVWNPYIGRFSDFDLANFSFLNCKISSYAASIGVDKLDDTHIEKIKSVLSNYKNISVREVAGKNLLSSIISNKSIEVNIDPTLLLNEEQWIKVAKKPDIYDGSKYILCYFLGKINTNQMNEINRIASEKNCKVINLLDKNDEYYYTGPSEFIWLEANAEYIFTDSFHSSVFALIFNKSFIIFDRIDDNKKMNSRLETLINMFKLKNRKFEGKITEENLNHDYSEAYKILEEERKKSEAFLKKALDIKE